MCSSSSVVLALPTTAKPVDAGGPKPGTSRAGETPPCEKKASRSHDAPLENPGDDVAEPGGLAIPEVNSRVYTHSFTFHICTLALFSPQSPPILHT